MPCFERGFYVPVRSDGSSSLGVPDSGGVGCCPEDTVPVAVSDTATESRDSAIFRLTPARVVKSARHGAARRDAAATYLVGSPRIRTRGPLFRNFHARQARDTDAAPTSRQMAIPAGCASVRHLAGRFERPRNNRIRSDRYAARAPPSPFYAANATKCLSSPSFLLRESGGKSISNRS